MRTSISIVIVILAVMTLSPLSFADGTETLGTPSVTVATGSGITAAGVGLATSQPGTINLSVPSDATVQQVLLYWSCQGNTTTGDNAVTLNASLNVTGTSIGGPTNFFGSVYVFAYRADITGLGVVTPGSSSVSVSDLACDSAYENSGAGILVIYQRSGQTASSIAVKDGLDFAYKNFAPTLDTTVPQTFTFPAVAFDRVADLSLFVASVEGPDVAGPRPNVITLTVDGTSTSINNALASTDGKAWDTLHLPVNIPAGKTDVTVQILSDDPLSSGDNPASLAWIMAGLSVPPPASVGACTLGYWKNHPDDWPVSSLTLGSQTYTKAELLALLNLSPRGDASIILAHQLIAAKLNIAAGTDSSSITSTVAAADGYLSQYLGKLPYNVTNRTDSLGLRNNMTTTASALDTYNNGTCRD